MTNDISVKRIWWNDSCLTADKETKLRFHSEYHGDRDEEWVLVIKGGKEEQRHNVRYIATIEWCEPQELTT